MCLVTVDATKYIKDLGYKVTVQHPSKLQCGCDCLCRCLVVNHHFDNVFHTSYWSIALVATPTPTASPRRNEIHNWLFSSTKKHFFVPLPSFQTFKCNRWKFQVDKKVSLSSIQEGQTLSQQKETKKKRCRFFQDVLTILGIAPYYERMWGSCTWMQPCWLTTRHCVVGANFFGGMIFQEGFINNPGVPEIGLLQKNMSCFFSSFWV